MTKDDVIERLAFAERRLQDILNLNDGNLPGAEPSERQQIIQEFFFHLVGTTEVLAQLVNEARSLGLDTEDVNVSTVADKLANTDPIKSLLGSLYQRTRKKRLLGDPHSDQGYIFRILNYRNQVTHRRRNPFLFRIGSIPSTSFWIDSRDQSIGASSKSAQEELEYMFQLVSTQCKSILSLL